MRWPRSWTHPGRRGYAVVAGHDLDAVGPEVLLEQAFAQAWGVRLGSTFFVQGLGPQTVVGFVEAPDNVGFPLAKPRFYVSRSAIDARFGPEPNPEVNLAEIWLRDPRYLDEVLVQARTSSFGLHDIRFATRSGLRVLLDQAAGIVIDLLVALSVIALVDRRRDAGGFRQGGGAATPGRDRREASGRRVAVARRAGAGVGGEHDRRPGGDGRVGGGRAGDVRSGRPAVDAAQRAAAREPAGAAAGCGLAGERRDPGRRGGLAGVAVGWALARRLVARRRAGRCRARPASPRDSRLRRRAGGLGTLGARLVGARRVRLVATVVTLGLSTAFVLLMLALASALSTLETDPGALGKRYQLTASLPAGAVPQVLAIPGVQAAAPRYEVQASRLVLAGRDDRCDRLSGRSHGV